jgi:hypothetical protein
MSRAPRNRLLRGKLRAHGYVQMRDAFQAEGYDKDTRRHFILRYLLGRPRSDTLR